MLNLTSKISFLCLFLLATFVQAEELSFSISQNFSACNSQYNALNVKTNYAEFKYNSINKELNIEVEFTNQGGATLANGFHFGLNSETSLILNKYKLAYFYVDASRLTSNNQPRISAYIYNRETQANSSCNNLPGSWQTNPGAGLNRTEPILLSNTPNTNPEWVLFAESSEANSGGVQTRKFSIIIDTTPIQAFVPNNTTDYQQEMAISCKNIDPVKEQACFNQYNNITQIFDFGQLSSVAKRLTLDFVPSVINNSTYNSANEITAFSLSACSLCRVEKKFANTAPSCAGITGLAEKLAVGEPVQANINFLDPDLYDQHRVQFLSALKPSMQFVTTSSSNSSETSPIANNGIIPTGHKKSVKLNWTPTTEDIGSYSIPVRFQQIYGVNGSLTSIDECTLNFEVIQGINSPVCETTDLTSNVSLIKNQLTQLKSLLLSKNRNNQKYLSSSKQQQRQDVSAKINTYSSTIENYIADIPLQFTTCSSGFSECQTFSVEDQLLRSRKDIPLLYCDGQKILGCNFIDNVGLKLFKKLKKNQINSSRVAGTLTAAKLALFTNQFKNAQKKATNLSFNAYNQVEELVANHYIQHFICE